MDPLKRIAITRLDEESDYYLIQWWSEKYNRPPNHPLLQCLTWEELYLEYLTDFYAKNPQEYEKAKEELGEKIITWSGSTSEEYEKEIKEKLKSIPSIDLSQWQVDVEKGEDEFDDVFEDNSGETK